MSDASVRDAELRRELGVPPSFDLLGHLRDLARVAVPALLIAAVLGGLVYLVRGMGAEVYESKVVAEIDSSKPLASGDANLQQLTAPYVALSKDADVVNTIAADMGDGWTTRQVEADVAVTPGTSPAIIDVSARAGSQQDADRLAGIVVTVLDAAQTGRSQAAIDGQIRSLSDTISALQPQLAADPGNIALQNELDGTMDQLRSLRTTASSDRLQTLSSPAGTGSPVAPKPGPEAAVATVVLFFVVAEVLVLVRSRWGRTNTPAWARRIARRHRAAVQVEHSASTTLPASTTVMIDQRAGLGDRVLILTGSRVGVDPTGFSSESAERITLRTMHSRWWLDVPTDTIAVALVVVDARDSERELVDETMRALADIGTPTRLVLLGAAGSLLSRARKRWSERRARRTGGADAVSETPIRAPRRVERGRSERSDAPTAPDPQRRPVDAPEQESEQAAGERVSLASPTDAIRITAQPAAASRSLVPPTPDTERAEGGNAGEDMTVPISLGAVAAASGSARRTRRDDDGRSSGERPGNPGSRRSSRSTSGRSAVSTHGNQGQDSADGAAGKDVAAERGSGEPDTTARRTSAGGTTTPRATTTARDAADPASDADPVAGVSDSDFSAPGRTTPGPTPTRRAHDPAAATTPSASPTRGGVDAARTRGEDRESTAPTGSHRPGPAADRDAGSMRPVPMEKTASDERNGSTRADAASSAADPGRDSSARSRPGGTRRSRDTGGDADASAAAPRADDDMSSGPTSRPVSGTGSRPSTASDSSRRRSNSPTGSAPSTPASSAVPPSGADSTRVAATTPERVPSGGAASSGAADVSDRSSRRASSTGVSASVRSSGATPPDAAAPKATSSTAESSSSPGRVAASGDPSSERTAGRRGSRGQGSARAWSQWRDDLGAGRGDAERGEDGDGGVRLDAAGSASDAAVGDTGDRAGSGTVPGPRPGGPSATDDDAPSVPGGLRIDSTALGDARLRLPQGTSDAATGSSPRVVLPGRSSAPGTVPALGAENGALARDAAAGARRATPTEPAPPRPPSSVGEEATESAQSARQSGGTTPGTTVRTPRSDRVGDRPGAGTRPDSGSDRAPVAGARVTDARVPGRPDSRPSEGGAAGTRDQDHGDAGATGSDTGSFRGVRSHSATPRPSVETVRPEVSDTPSGWFDAAPMPQPGARPGPWTEPAPRSGAAPRPGVSQEASTPAVSPEPDTETVAAPPEPDPTPASPPRTDTAAKVESVSDDHDRWTEEFDQSTYDALFDGIYIDPDVLDADQRARDERTDGTWIKDLEQPDRRQPLVQYPSGKNDENRRED